MFPYSFFILCTESHVARMQIKCCRTWPHHTEGWAGLPYEIDSLPLLRNASNTGQTNLA